MSWADIDNLNENGDGVFFSSYGLYVALAVCESEQTCLSVGL